MSDPQPTEPTEPTDTGAQPTAEPEPQQPADQPPADGDKGFPDATPVKDMTVEQQAAYWRHQAQKHENAWRGRLGKYTPDQVAELERRSQELKSLEDANKTEEQKRAEREQALVDEASTLKAELERTRAAVKYGLTEDDLAALDGIPADKVDAIAGRLSAGRPPAPKAPSAEGQGSDGKPIDATPDIDAQISEAQKAGNVGLALSLTNQKLVAKATGKD